MTELVQVRGKTISALVGKADVQEGFLGHSGYMVVWRGISGHSILSIAIHSISPTVYGPGDDPYGCQYGNKYVSLCPRRICGCVRSCDACPLCMF